MLTVMVAIATWCSAPSGYRLTEDQVQRCRENLIICMGDDGWTDSKIKTCFKAQKLN